MKSSVPKTGDNGMPAALYILIMAAASFSITRLKKNKPVNIESVAKSSKQMIERHFIFIYTPACPLFFTAFCRISFASLTDASVGGSTPFSGYSMPSSSHLYAPNV